MKRATKAQREDLDEYVDYYLKRSVHGVWFPLATAIKAVLVELDAHRAAEKARRH